MKNNIRHWRDAFEDMLAENLCMTGGKGIALLEEKLPCSCYLFNCPNYSYLPTTQHSEQGNVTFAYKVTNLQDLDRPVFNNLEVIICEENLSFMCAFNHEAPDWVPEVFCEV